MDLCRALEGRSALAPGNHDAPTVVGHRSLEAWMCRSHKIGDSATHAEPDDAQSVALHQAMAGQEIYRGVDVFDHGNVPQPSPPCRSIVPTVGGVAVVQVRGDAEIAGAGDALGHFLHELIDASLMLNDDDSRKRTRAVGHAHIEAHVGTINLSTVPVRCHWPTLLSGLLIKLGRILSPLLAGEGFSGGEGLFPEPLGPSPLPSPAGRGNTEINPRRSHTPSSRQRTRCGGRSRRWAPASYR